MYNAIHDEDDCNLEPSEFSNDKWEDEYWCIDNRTQNQLEWEAVYAEKEYFSSIYNANDKQMKGRYE